MLRAGPGLGSCVRSHARLPAVSAPVDFGLGRLAAMSRPHRPGCWPAHPGVRAGRGLHAAKAHQGAPALPVDEIETRYCQYVDEVLNHHHPDRLAAYLTPD